MSQRIMYHNPEGQCCIVIPAPNSGLSLHEIAGKDVPPGVDWTLVDEDAIPSDRTYRNAWRGDMKNSVIGIDMAKARDIQRAAIRAARAAAFPALDVEAIRAQETGDAATLQSVVAKKQALRDAPADPRIEAAMTTDELRKVWPDGLGLNPMERRVETAAT